MREAVEHRAQHPVVRAEIVAPLGHAMRLVDREQRDFRAFEQRLEPRGRSAFGGDIEQIERAAAESLGGGGVVAVGRGHRGGADARGRGRTDLVMHQRDQRRDDDGRARTGERGNLVAQALARARGHQRKAVLAGHHPRNHRFLLPAKAGKAESAAQDIVEIGGKGRVHCRGPSRSSGD